MSQGLTYSAGIGFLTSNLPDNTTPPTVRWHGQYYQKTEACYRPVSDELLEADFVKWVARNPAARTDANDKIQPVTTTFVRNALLALQAESQLPDSTRPGSWLLNRPGDAVGPFLATLNGILDLGRLDEPWPVFLPDSRYYFDIAAIPVTIDPSSECSAWLRLLGQAFGSDQAAIDLIQELFGYALLPDCRFESFFILYGPANTGKSTVAEVLLAMLGKDNVAALPFERFGERFALTSLVGKMANIVFDVSEIDRTAEGTLKALVSGEPVTVESKHGPLGPQRLTAKHIFLGNVLPRFHDTTEGLWRRVVVIPFERVCPPDQRDRGLKTRLLSELPGIALWAIRGLARLLRVGSFTQLQRGIEMVAEYRQESNPVSMFLAEECLTAANAREGRKAMYSSYRDWVAANGHAPCSAARFYREVRALIPQPAEEVREGRGGDRMFVGIRLRSRGDILRQIRFLTSPTVEDASP